MSMGWYLINKRDKTFYDLGAGGWYSLDDHEAFSDLEYLTHEILYECFYIDEPDYRTEEEKDKVIDHITDRVAPDLHKMCNGCGPDEVWVIPDNTDDLVFARTKEYRCIGTRYYDKNSDDYKTAIIQLNRPLDDDLWKSRYVPTAQFLERYAVSLAKY